jgi:stringent starvation protein B
MTSNRPYLIRALYDWLVDNDLTPYLLVDAQRNDVHVPADYVENGRIVLNVSPSAVRGLELGNEQIGFEARFSGTAHIIALPPAAVLGVYARENGKGMLFPDDHDEEPTPPEPPSSGKPALKVVK